MWSRVRDQSGVTLVELLVVLVILGVVGSVVTTAIVSSLRSAAVTTDRVIAINELETAMQRMTRDLRAARPALIFEGEDIDRSVGAVVDQGAGEREIKYFVTDQDGRDVLIREVRESDSLQVSQTLVTLVDNEDIPVFEYIKSDGQPVDCAGLPHEDCADEVRRAPEVRIRLVRGIERRDRRPVTVETIVSVRNVRYVSSD